MIPCASTCPHYAAGCHKVCAQWREYVRRNQEDHKARAAWLHDQNLVSSDVLRTFRAIGCCHNTFRG